MSQARKQKSPNKAIPPKTSKVPKAVLKAALEKALANRLVVSKRECVSVLEACMVTVQEFLSSFIIIGYDCAGEPVQMTCAKSQQDLDALAIAINRFIINSN